MVEDDVSKLGGDWATVDEEAVGELVVERAEEGGVGGGKCSAVMCLETKMMDVMRVMRGLLFHCVRCHF